MFIINIILSRVLILLFLLLCQYFVVYTHIHTHSVVYTHTHTHTHTHSVGKQHAVGSGKVGGDVLLSKRAPSIQK